MRPQSRTKNYRLNLIVFSLLGIAMLAACATLPAAPATTSQMPAPTQAPTTSPPAATQAPVITDSPEPELRPFPVADVRVQIGHGSPIPVEVFVSGESPDLCAQLASVKQSFSGNRFDIALLATPADPSCPPDYLGLPFRFILPLNMVEVPQGSYTVSVNGMETSFDWSGAGSGTLQAPAGGELRQVAVEDVRVEIGWGSPIPVEVKVVAAWPDLCAQISSIEQKIDGNRVEISLLASPAPENCPPDFVGLTYGIAIPINIVELPLGEYTVAVNGVETIFEWDGQPGTMFIPRPESIAYIGADGNVWMVDRLSGVSQQVTMDGTPMFSTESLQGDVVSYNFPALSSDGTLVAYRRDAGTPVEWGMQYEFGLWVTHIGTGESRQIMDQVPAGIAWKPGTHLLTYGIGVAEGYFTARGQVDADLATGIWAVDLDQGEPFELVRPERGYSLARPLWSPDGSVLGFEEVYNMEGSGLFAAYDLNAQKYNAWEKALGLVDLSPDGILVAYDFMTYSPTGTERVYLNSIQGGAERQFSPDLEQGYAYHPVFSLQGLSVAYLVNKGMLDDTARTLVVQDLAGGEPVELGVFEAVNGLGWSPDGASLVFSAGPYDAPQVIAVSLADGSSTVLGQGSSPALTTP